MKAFGPVPSRRLGQSLGVNNIPPKVCTYSCIYCQIGKTEGLSNERRVFCRPEDLASELPAYAEGPTRLCGDECVAGNPP
jgi:wyosine [tRNA(Phe)-imidazoG37] synthetase (radical SAM superfamily)